MKDLIRNNRDLLLFLAKLGALCAFYFLWFSPRVWQLPVISTYYGHYIHYTLLTLGESSIWVLNALGFEAELIDMRNIDLYDSIVDIHIRNYCLGIDMMFTLTALIISFPGKWKDRLWFIPMGIIGIQIINIARVVGLCLSWIILQRGDFVDHHDVFNIVAVTFIFLLFRAWVKRYKKGEPA
ncbi:MAG: hypothetical protein JKX84_11540 [Flavobacteriales bacterium]|nr:hypothetical protein [Flavobacteriales bacterium]